MFNLPKGLIETVTKQIQKDQEDKAIFEAIMEEYGVSDPMQLSEEMQDEFYVLGVECLGEAYVGFNKLKRRIAARGGVRNAGAIAASIGRKKYGKKKFEDAAKEHKKLKPKKKGLKEDYEDRQKEKERDKERRNGRQAKEQQRAPEPVKESEQDAEKKLYNESLKKK